MQQYQEMNLAKITSTCERILQMWQFSRTGIPRDLRVYGGLIIYLMIWNTLFFAVFMFWFMFSAIVKVFSYFWDRNILWAKYPSISGRTGDLLLRIFGKVCVLPVNHLSENWITAKRRDFCHQYSHNTNFYGFYLNGHRPSHAWVIFLKFKLNP